ncbi:Peptidase M1 membrane alanine aminopeptidase [Isosphaera pallida ATCC 43644]|uniref:Aminopeptidase N n=2 Tax=Isosphaera pallida TaxID=128 RepID=E8QZF2_ISOPI|nr:Peptidase M1 membrane alanine aminopeptidase [Isosphaera pallida ATCC 43644]
MKHHALPNRSLWFLLAASASQTLLTLVGWIAFTWANLLNPISSRADFPMNIPAASEHIDTHSRGRPWEIAVNHLALDLTADFQAKRLQGEATLTLKVAPDVPKETHLYLDVKGLDIIGVAAVGPVGEPECPLSYRLDGNDPILGSALIVTPPEGDPARFATTRVKITYRTTPEAGALQWLEPVQTAGGRHPFLFSQSQAIQARTWLPLQDSPGARLTFEAILRVPPELTALMAAQRLQPRPDDPPGLFRFRLDQSIPPYLIALAVGDLAFAPLGPRCGVFAEPSVLPKAAAEFDEIEAMIAAVEARFGPYRWGRHDILVLPPSFPFGGMENPCLTFATPTILAGDKSLVALICHELAHSWSGNLVTHATWRDFWLNEGFTVYLERRILEQLYGPERRDMEAVLGYESLKQALKDLPEADQRLYIDLTGRDPDDGLTEVPYEKGALLLTRLEQAFGRERFDRFLKDYFDHFAFQSIRTADFVDWTQTRLFPLDPQAAATIDLDAWLNQPGLPADAPTPRSNRFEAVVQVADQFARGQLPAEALPVANWTTHEWIHFLESLSDRPNASLVADLERVHHLFHQGNAEIRQRFLMLALRSDPATAWPHVERFLGSVGRRKFLMPLYNELIKTEEGRRRAEAIFEKAKAGYHPIAVDSIARKLAQAAGQVPPANVP